MNGIEQGVHDIMAKMDEVKNNINQLTEKKFNLGLKIWFMKKLIVVLKLKS